MADTIFTRALAHAAASQESTQALAGQLRVPEGTLLRWMSGRAQMPYAAFRRLIELLLEYERSIPVEAQPENMKWQQRTLTFNLGDVQASCARCGAAQFLPADPGAVLRMSSMLRCASCSSSMQQSELLLELAQRAIQRSREAAMLRKGAAGARAGAKVVQLGRR